MKKENIIKYYESILKDLNISKTPLIFKKINKGQAYITHDNKGKIFNITISNECGDVEYALLHEIAHKICIEKKLKHS